MKEKENKRAKCPVCGRFTGEKTVEAFKAEYNNKITALSVALESERKRVENQAKWLDEKNKKYDALTRKYDLLGAELTKARKEIERMKSRGLWERILNR